MMDHWEVSTDGERTSVTVNKDNMAELGLNMSYSLSTVLYVENLNGGAYLGCGGFGGHPAWDALQFDSLFRRKSDKRR